MKDELMTELVDFELSTKNMSDLRGGRPTLVSEEFWTDGLNTYRDSTWSDGSEVCSQFWGCDCGNSNGGKGSGFDEAASTVGGR